VPAGRPYTAFLWHAFLGAGETLGPVVPAGHLWVLRDIVMYCNSGVAYEQVPGCLIKEATHLRILWGVGSADAAGGRVFHEEIRQVLNAGEQLAAFTGSFPWQVTISGYDFLVPA
jgi:hypothetical protein